MSCDHCDALHRLQLGLGYINNSPQGVGVFDPFDGPDGAAQLTDIDYLESSRPELRAVPVLPEADTYQRLVKPVLDRVAGVILSIVTFPIVLIGILLILATIGRPPIFRQRRIGLHGRDFTVYKLRTMRHDRRARQLPYNGPERRENHKSSDDPRHTRLGRLLRKWSIDELPQLWNVAIGDMSLVGPRPELPALVAKYDDWQHERHNAKPGMTGLWQISARGEIPMHEATDIDVAYVRSITFLGDMKILFSTIPAMLRKQQGS
jgi:lipopolysaccharide/colanic/teichoic acid biosynthesis glycosyltransferase